MAISIPFDNSYGRLPDGFYTRQNAGHVSAPSMMAWNADLADLMGIKADDLAEAAQVFGGNVIPDGADPLAQVYAGHQFGGWSAQLGDGRALLLGETIGTDGQRRDIQLKGSGPTPYSRAGDGRAGLGPVVREYLMSEAMHALGVPTTRALAAVRTGDQVFRDTMLPGAVLTRVAASHIRVGTFQYFAARGDTVALQALLDHVIARHYPEAMGPAQLLKAVMRRQAKLIAHWMSLGFIHGVMNTDNVQIAGETIDYGPCAFMDIYHPQRVFSSIDRGGRYAYGNQPNIAIWNVAQFATSLIPLMTDREAAIEEFTEIVNGFPAIYQEEWMARFRAKLGLTRQEDDDLQLIEELLALMTEGQADFTNLFAALPNGTARDHITDPAQFDAWAELRHARLVGEDGADALMRRTNPIVIPRTHLIEEAIVRAAAGDDDMFHDMHSILGTPFEMPDDPKWTRPPTPEEIVPATFCGT